MTSFLNFPVTLTNKPPSKLASLTDADRLALTGLYLSADLDQLVRELLCLYQVTRAAYEHSRCLQTLVRPFLSRMTWIEVAKVARRGGQTLPAEPREASILRLDIANFTGLIDSHPLDKILTDLNTYLDQLSQLVYGYSGDVDKYLGDGLLGVFNDANDAVQAGGAIQQVVAEFNRRQSAKGRVIFPTRLAIDTGQVVITSLGSPDRQDRTVMGMPVNLAERLQAQAIPGRVWFSQATFDRLRDQSSCCCLGPIKVKGRHQPVVVYEKLLMN